MNTDTFCAAEVSLMNSWIGKPIDPLYSLWGEPTTVTEYVKSLMHIYEWHSHMVDGVQFCKSLTTDHKHVVIAWSIKARGK